MLDHSKQQRNVIMILLVSGYPATESINAYPPSPQLSVVSCPIDSCIDGVEPACCERPKGFAPAYCDIEIVVKPLLVEQSECCF